MDVDEPKYSASVGTDTMGDSRTVSGWLACPVADASEIERFRDRLYEWLETPDSFRHADDPHLSLFGVRIPGGRAARFERELESFAEAIGPRNCSTDGYLLYPSTRNPMVVSLDLPVPLTALASPIADLLALYDGRISRSPVSPHVTLLKGGARGVDVQWARIDARIRRRLAAVAGESNRCDPPRRLVEPTIEITLDPPAMEWDRPI